MGEVYRATDTKLGRAVALKVLPAEMAHDAERLGRFRREAKTLAQLDHPNIVTIYSVEECGGVHFLTMQLVDGQPLDRLIPQGGLSIERIVEIGSALADALAAAHEKGIVHRDLKPANVMVSHEGRVKVLDFGLAKDVRASNLNDATMTSASHTQVGVVMGTPAYMSPEQTSGRPLDHRTDIFSLGVVLHEMSTGRRPFDGTSSAELVSAILRDTPPSVTDLRADLPGDLARVIRRCLEKDPRHRLQTARDISNEFRDLVRSTTRQSPIAKTPTQGIADSSEARPDQGFWVAVLPFKYTGTNAELTALTEGLSEEIVTGLSRFSYLRVIARSSTARYAGQSVDVRNAGKELNARYVMEGTLRQAGSRLRLAVQLVDTVSGAHLWAENYERAFSAEAVFELQDDLVPRIVSTVADMNGVLPRSMSEGLRNRAPEELSPYEAVLRSFAYTYSATPEELTAARSALEGAVRKAPAFSDAWAMLSFLCGQDYVHGYELQDNALEIAISAARRAVALGPSNHLAYFSLGQALWSQKDYDSFRDAVERAVGLNPMDGNCVAYLGELLTYAGSAERGMQLVERAKQLNPNHPGWYWFADFYHAFSQSDYRGALGFALKAKLRGNPLAPMFVAAACGQLEDVEGGAKAAADLMKFRPELPAIMRKQVAKVWPPEYGERFLEGLRKAGLDIPEAGARSEKKSVTSPSIPAKTRDSGAARADEGFWVAVLPFKYVGGTADLAGLAEGLTDDIVTNMSRFSYLRVIARSSTAQYAQRTVDVRTAARELGARYVMEGSVRQAGAKVRIAVQLVDAESGAGLWAETYDRAFSADAVLELLDDVVPRIVCTVADTQGVLAHSMTDTLRNRDPETLTPYEAVLRSFGHHQRVNAAEHLAARTALERAVKQPPDRADCWATLAWLYREEYTHGFNVLPDPLGRALTASRRALDAGPTNHLAHAALASTLFFLNDHAGFRASAERAIVLNPLEGYTLAYLGMLIAYSGDWERGCALADRAMQLNPNHPGWYWFPRAFNAYRQRDYEGTLGTVLKVNMPGFWRTQLLLAAAHGQLGNREAAGNAVRELLKIRPTFKDLPRNELKKWHDEELKEHLLEGLGKAGLDIYETAAPAATASTSSSSGETRADEGFWVAVLPFKYTGGNQELRALAEGLSEEVITGLSRFSYLRVIARGSTAKYSSESGDVRAIGKELGARYVMEASLRQAGSRLRLAVQLVEATSGSHLWAETYERRLNAEDFFAVQDDITDRVVATVADSNGVLVRSIAAGIEEKPEAGLTALDWMLRCFNYRRNITPEAHAELRDGLERFVKREPKHAEIWAWLALVYLDEFSFGFNLGPDPLGRAFAAARQSVKIDRTCQSGNQLLAHVHFFRRDIPAFRAAAEEAIALNPRNTEVLAHLAVLFVFTREFEHGVKLARRAMDLNPHHAGWYHVPLVWDYFQKGEYEQALDQETRINIPGLFWQPLAVAACCGLMGRHAEAVAAAEELRRLDQDIEQHLWRHIEIYNYASGFMERILEGLAKAGLHITAPGGEPPSAEKMGVRQGEAPQVAKSPTAASPSDQPTPSGALRASEGFWLAVLPFKYTGNNPDLKALAEGLSEEVITGLSRFSYLRVIARGSTAKYSSESGDVRAIGKELGARYVMEASLRQAGNKLRLAVQLADTVSGAHLWAETYERPFTPETVFDVQDDLVPRIVSTVADQYGVLPRSMGEGLRNKAEDKLTPHEAVLRTFSYFSRIGAEEHKAVRSILERTVRDFPDHADSWAMLSMIYRGEFAQEYNPEPNPLQRALDAAQRAVDLAPTNALGHYALATVHFFRKEMIPFRVEAERALALNPLDASVKAYLGLLIASSGEWDRGCHLVDSAMQLNPNCPGYFYFAGCWNAYRQGKYSEVLEAVARINMPNYFHVPAIQAAALGQLGRKEEAQQALREVLALRPHFAATVRQEYGKWYEPEQIERILDGLRKAGLEIPGDR